MSLVPSLTEALATSVPERLVGATDWCTHPADLDDRGVARVRGTKNPDLAAILALRPDVVVANKEENRELDVRRLRQHGIPVWVTDIETVPGALSSMRRLFREVLGLGEDPPWLAAAEQAWGGPVPAATARVVVPIWRDPWMVVGHPTFTADLLARAGFEVVTAGVARSLPGRRAGGARRPDGGRSRAAAGRAVRVHGRRRAGGVSARADPPGLRPADHLVRPVARRLRGFRWTDPERVMSPWRPAVSRR